MQVQMLKNTLLSWRWIQYSRILVFSGHFLPPAYLCALSIFGPQHDTHVEKDDIEQRVWWKLVLPTTHPQLLLTPKFKERRLASNTPPSASTSQIHREVHRKEESRWLSREQGEGLEDQEAYLELSSANSVIPTAILPYLRGHVKVSVWVSLASSDIGVFM